MNSFFKSVFFKSFLILSLVFLLPVLHNPDNLLSTSSFTMISDANAVPPPRGASSDPIERNRKARAEKIKREKARRDSINCYITERKKLEDGGLTCIYKCPKGRTESNSIGPGFRCPTMMNVLRRE